MRKVKIPKGNGKHRLIYIPSMQEKNKLRHINGAIEQKVRKKTKGNVIHGFTIGKSPVTNAWEHVGYDYSLCFDLKDFFESVTPEKLNGLLTVSEKELVFVDGAARQGLPTSPSVANLAAISIDEAILKFLGKNCYETKVSYTRYADDLTFSFNNPSIIEKLKIGIPKIVSKCGFKVNPDKTCLQNSRSGRRIITGIGVGQESLFPTREIKRKLRAAIHQGNKNEEMGLNEWCKLKLPQPPQVDNFYTLKDEVNKLTKLWKLPKVIWSKVPKRDEVQIDEDCIITADIPYILGMSTYTNGWTSCLNQISGQHRKRVMFWVYYGGTRLALLLSKNELTFGGVKRRAIIARTLVHTLEDGRLVQDRCYGSQSTVLSEKLRKNKVLELSEVRTNKPLRVIGECSTRFSPYLDRLTQRTKISTGGVWKDKMVTNLYIN